MNHNPIIPIASMDYKPKEHKTAILQALWILEQGRGILGVELDDGEVAISVYPPKAYSGNICRYCIMSNFGEMNIDAVKCKNSKSGAKKAILNAANNLSLNTNWRLTILVRQKANSYNGYWVKDVLKK